MGRTQHTQARSVQTTKHKSTPHCAGHTEYIRDNSDKQQTNKQTKKNTQTEIKENKKKNRYINSKLIQTNIQIICIRYEHNATRKQNLLENTKKKKKKKKKTYGKTQKKKKKKKKKK